MLSPQDAHIARRVRPPERYLFPTANRNVSRDAAPMREGPLARVADRLRESDWAGVGKPFNPPGMAIAFTFSPQQWEESLPLGFVRKPLFRLTHGVSRGRGGRDGASVNIEQARARAYGSLVTVDPEPGQRILGIGA
jgi:hypothetical protein